MGEVRAMLCEVRVLTRRRQTNQLSCDLRSRRDDTRRGETRQTKGDNKSNKCQATTTIATTKATTTAICSFIIAAAKFMRTTRTNDRLNCPADPIAVMSNSRGRGRASRGNTPPAPLHCPTPDRQQQWHVTTQRYPASHEDDDQI